MRDPLSWSIPLFRAFGIQVRLHILYIIITLGFILREVSRAQVAWAWVDSILIWVVILFFIILLHEFGHCFAARREGGDAEEILIWPLGGLAYCDVPQVARAHFITAAGGPFVNVLICIVCALMLIPSNLLPPLNPFNVDQLYVPQLHNWMDGSTWYRPGEGYLTREGSSDPLPYRAAEAFPVVIKDDKGRDVEKWYFKPEGRREAPYQVNKFYPQQQYYSPLVLWTARVFWMSWILLLFNMLPAFPLDCGRLVQSFVWARSGDYRRGTLVAVYTGFVVAIGFVVVSFWIIDPILLGLAIFIWVFCRQQYIALEMAENESVFGYDFSQGYTSLEKDEPPPPKQKKLGPVQRFLQTRRERRAQREAEQKAADEARMDQLLDKIHRQGKEALTDEERRFMDRVSARYRNRS